MARSSNVRSGVPIVARVSRKLGRERSSGPKGICLKICRNENFGIFYYKRVFIWLGLGFHIALS